MQGPSSSVSTLPENISFDHGSASGDSTIESQMPWTSMQTTVQNRLPDYRMSSSSETNNQYLQHVRREGPSVEWSVGETSSSSSQRLGDQNERKMEHTWTFGPRTNLALEERQYEQSDILSLDNIDVNSHGSQSAHGAFGLRTSSSNALPQDLNMISGFVDSEDDDCQVVERPSSYISIGPSNEQMQAPGTSSDSFSMPPGRGGYVMDEREDRPGCSMDGRRMSCKRKALEVHTGQSSGVGSSSCFQHDERSQWHTMPAAHVAVSNTSMPMSTDNDAVVHNGSEPANPRLRLGVGAAGSAPPFSLTSSGNAESSRRNFRLRVNGLYQQESLPNNPFSTETDVGNVDVSSSRYSSRLLRNHLFDMSPAPTVENATLNSQPALHVPPVRRHHQSRWSGASSSRSSRSSAAAAAAAAVSEDRMPFGEPSSRHIPRSISEHPMFVPASEMGNSSQNPTNWNFPGGNNSMAGNAASSSRAGTSTGLNASAPSWSHRNHLQYPRRLSEIVRRSLLPSAGAEAGGQSGNHAARSGSSALPQEMVLPSGSDSHGHRALNSRSAYLDRHLDGAFGVPYSLRTLAAAGEGRGSIMSEIRQVLDLMRRGEGLRFEDVMILDHSVLFGMADIHDRHRDMRLDVDNMSYEELLALEERIGNVCTGLTEEAVTSRLKRRKYVASKADNPAETEPCSICREEYNNGEDLGALECGHDFHADCIKQWLMHKNLCPICKTTGLTT
ncbi:probable E3 ubiquitin-protein ligase RHG1A isoform X2 [Salvia miltiorrhiza]|uniref:probable E3 ubiquitin-protein ligase RHG1A isoform X2 n=1 Tax=Salvia miltiorrhiza TaxID=226208 RepID=UPI0025AC9816|nr:probable E3 ubiquitin-protein ligase RHG1A isoform X2 [Salvia miltiorrhiza]